MNKQFQIKWSAKYFLITRVLVLVIVNDTFRKKMNEGNEGL